MDNPERNYRPLRRVLCPCPPCPIQLAAVDPAMYPEGVSVRPGCTSRTENGRYTPVDPSVTLLVAF